MSPYYDQSTLRQRGPEDVAGILVLVTCAVLAFAWYVAVSRLHLNNQQCLEIFLYGAILFFGGGLLIAQLVGRRRRREENWRSWVSLNFHKREWLTSEEESFKG